MLMQAHLPSQPHPLIQIQRSTEPFRLKTESLCPKAQSFGSNLKMAIPSPATQVNPDGTFTMQSLGPGVYRLAVGSNRGSLARNCVA